MSTGMRWPRLVMIFLMLNIGSVASLSGQSDKIYTDAYLNAINGPGYVGPFSDAVASNLNTQLFPFAHSDSSISLHIGMVASRAFISDAMKSHTGTTIGLNSEQQLEVPTIFGANESVLAQDSDNSIYLFPGGFAMQHMSFLVPQVSVSGLFNTDITARFMTVSIDDDFEDFTMYGIAVRHHLRHYLPASEKFDLSVGYAYNSIDADKGTVNNHSHFAFAEAAFSGPDWRLFAHAGYVYSYLDIDYTGSETSIDFETSGSSNFRYGAGVCLGFGPIDLSLQADLMNPIVFSGYIGLKF